MRQKDNFQKFIDQDGALDILCRHLANGGNIIEFCEMMDVPFCDLTTWASKPENIDQYKMAIFSQSEWAVQKILGELKDMSYEDRTQIFEDDGTIKPVTAWPQKIKKSIAGIDVKYLDDGSQVNKIKFESKTKTIEMMMKNLGILTERSMSLQFVGEDKKFLEDFFGLNKKPEKTGEKQDD